MCFSISQSTYRDSFSTMVMQRETNFTSILQNNCLLAVSNGEAIPCRHLPLLLSELYITDIDLR